MSQPILTTKLFVPPLQPNLVVRQRLVDRLNAGLGRKLTLVCAPAGFGKTTLLAEWRHELDNGEMDGADSSPPRFAWLSLDESDNDPAHFLSYVTAALQRALDGLGETAVTLLQSPTPPPATQIVTYLINDIAGHPGRIVLILDDYHAIDNPAIHHLLAFLLDHLPPQLHVALTSRVDPPLPLARLRARGLMTEIRADDLRFTTDEAAAFLQRTWQIDASPEHVAALEARTEGWIAGLQLAALSLQRLHGEADIASFITDFTGSHRFVLDYLLDEVLHQQPAETQEFLLRTAILERLSAELCDAVLQSERSQAMLERLEAANLFIVPLDDRRLWYRYHHLFADLLRHRLKQTWPQLLPALHRRASDWYEANGRTGRAIEHAMAAGETRRAAALVQEARWRAHGRGEMTTLQRWLRLLPESLVETTPALAIAHVWTLFYSGQLEEGVAYLRRFEAWLAANKPAGDQATEPWRGEMAVLWAQAAINKGDFDRALACALRAQATTPPENLVIHSIIENMLGKVYRMRGDLDAAARAYEKAQALGRRTDNHIAVLSGLTNQAALREAQGRLHEAERLQREALALARDSLGRPVPLAGVPLVGLGRIYREWGRLDEAEAFLDQAIQLGRRSGLDGLVVDGGITLALVHMAQGKAASETLQPVLEVVRRWQEPAVVLRLAAFDAWLRLAEGDLATAVRWAESFAAEHDPAAATAAGEPLEIEYTILARIWLAQEKHGPAEELLAQLLPPAGGTGRLGRVIEVLALRALAQQGNGDEDGALATVTRALTLAQPAGYVRLFADLGRPMGTLLARAALGETAVAHDARRILAAIEVRPEAAQEPGERVAANGHSPTRPDLAQWLVEPLSKRELEVLRLVADGLTNREIGERLVIAPATVKKHVENIHGKLYVRRRTHAVARARELGLL